MITPDCLLEISSEVLLTIYSFVTGLTGSSDLIISIHYAIRSCRMFILITGDVSQGFNHIGPFDSRDSAEDYGSGIERDYGGSIAVELECPDKSQVTASDTQGKYQQLGSLVADYFDKAGDDDINGGDLVDFINAAMVGIELK